MRYRGKYKLSIDLNPVYYLTVNGFDVTGSKSPGDAAVFAMYAVEFGVVFQYVPPSIDGGSGWLALVPGDHDLARGVLAFTKEKAARPMPHYGPNDSLSLVDLHLQRQVVANAVHGFRFWLPKGDYGLPWRLHPVSVWNDQSMVKADLTWVSLNGRDLKSVNLTGADLRHASLQGVTMSKATLKDVKCDGHTLFTGATLRHCDFTGAKLNGAQFQGAHLHDCTFGAADLTAVKLSAATKFTSSGLAGAKFDGNDCSGVDFTGARLNKATFLSSKLGKASFHQADLSEARLDSATAAGAKFTSAVLTGAKLAGATFDNDTDFTGATLFGIDFSGCNLTLPVFKTPLAWYDAAKPAPALLRRTTVPIALLGLADWSWLDLAGATVNGALPASLKDFKADHAVFPEGYDLTGRALDGASFRNATLHGVIFNEATCVDADTAPDFSEADLSRAKMYKVSLDGAKFNKAVLTGIMLTASRLIGANFSAARLHSEGADVADLSAAFLMDAKFDGASLGGSGEALGANFSHAVIFGQASFNDATMPRAQFSGAFLAGVQFQNIKDKAMNSVVFAEACLVGCSFAGTNLANATLNSACLHGADFSAASLPGAKMHNAAIARQEGTIAIRNFPFDLVTSLPYDPTKIDHVTTDAKTVCPNGPGPCSGAKWDLPTPPTEWVYTSQLWEGRTRR